MKRVLLKIVTSFFITVFISCINEEDGISILEVAEIKVNYSPIEFEVLYLINNYRECDTLSSKCSNHTKLK